MSEALLISALRVGTMVSLLGGVGVLVLSQGLYERASSLPEDVDPRDHMAPPHMVMHNPATVVLWAVTLVLSTLFVAASLPKLGDVSLMTRQFEGWGYTSWLRHMVGGVEFLGAIFLMIPRTAFWAACTLGAVMAGAIATHLAAGQQLMSVLPLAALGALSYVAAMRRELAFGVRPRG